MAFDFHKDKNVYFNMQTDNAVKYVLPFIEDKLPLKKGMTVLEIGCAEGGVLKAFLQRGCEGVGIELSEGRAELAKGYLEEYITDNKCQIISRNVYDEEFQADLQGKFDLIVLKDVIEHIHNQKKLMDLLHSFLKPKGHIYFGFPPWYMPFGGHQQVCDNKFLSKLPYYHILPVPVYKLILKLGGESELKVENLLEIKETGISLERFEKITKQTGYDISKKTWYLINPIYEYKFKLKPREQFGILGAIPFFRNFVTTCGYYLIQSKK